MRERATYFKQLHRRPVLWLAWAAAALYSSWPLGYVLNPIVSRHSLASQLEALHQPYAWVFISMDVLTGVAVTITGIAQIKMHGEARLLKWCAVGYIIFGVLVAAAALSPLNCDPEAGTCGPILHNPILIIHGASSVLSWGFLGLSVVVLGLSRARQHWSSLSTALFSAALLAWLASGIGSLAQLVYHIPGNFMQYYFITVCSFSIVLVVGAIEHSNMNATTVAEAFDD